MIEKTWLVVLGLVLVIFELLFGAIVGMDLVILGSSLIVSGMVFYYQGDWYQAITLTIILFTIYLVYLRKHYRKKLLILAQRMGIDTIVGKVGVVVSKISTKKPGVVLIDGETWLAQSQQNLKEKEEIVVTEYQSKTLIVSSLKLED